LFYSSLLLEYTFQQGFAMGMALIVKYRGNHIIPCFSILF
jgi:hypothetical protein